MWVYKWQKPFYNQIPLFSSRQSLSDIFLTGTTKLKPTKYSPGNDHIYIPSCERENHRLKSAGSEPNSRKMFPLMPLKVLTSPYKARPSSQQQVSVVQWQISQPSLLQQEMHPQGFSVTMTNKVIAHSNIQCQSVCCEVLSR